MSLSATITADLRARAGYLPPCPLCSFLGVQEQPDIIRGPSHRQFRQFHKLDQCCQLSANCPPMDSQAEVAAWWGARRQAEIKSCPSTETRRKSCLEKLRIKGHEPVNRATQIGVAAEGVLNASTENQIQ